LIAAVTLAAVALSAASGSAPARLALSVSPAHLSLAAGGRATIHVRVVPGGRLLLRTGIAGLALDARGRPQIVDRRDAAAWLTVQPRTISAGRGSATFVVTSRRPAGARPGDHTAIVLLTATAPGGKGIAVGMRVGLVVTVHAGGRVVRRLGVVALRSLPLKPPRRGRLVSLTVANRGDVIESIGGRALELALVRHGHVLVRFRAARRKLLPRTQTIVTFRVPPRIHGDVVALVSVTRPGGRTAARRFPLRM
jgi:hypothetical protein